jgi:hypothetical protein
MGVAAISYDSRAVLKDFADRRHITYPLLSDSESKIIRVFGILNEAAPKNTPFYGIPHPGTYILDPAGVVKAKYFEDGYRERDTASDILVTQFGVRPGLAHSTIETKHLKLSSSASAAVVHSGQHIALTLDVELPPKMHVYAPGVQGYIPIDWSMGETEAAKASAAVYPASKRLHLRAIRDTVPVYAGSFRLVREITIGPEAKLKPFLTAGGELTFEGSFRYQACDDRVCYLPQTVPLKWSFQFEPLDRERVPPALQRKSEPTK